MLRADEARRCVSAGASAIWVSNHGGRQLDLALDTASALPPVAAALGEDVEVYVDRCLRTGTHLLLAAALGARAKAQVSLVRGHHGRGKQPM
ncbi:MAG: alpha-hydroxy-acid oxidizing protein [Actinomycetota bacterium]|nr:alpha-hydroxy-acid oxidizing protein [Actinomycetota bacterium]